MNRTTGLILSLFVALLVLPAAADAQNQEPSNNMWTRSAALYMDRARSNSRPNEKKELYEQALQSSIESTQNDADNPKGWYLAGAAHIKLGNYVAADSMFDRAEQLYPEYEEVRLERMNAWIIAYNNGVTQIQQGNLDGAIEHMRKADVIYQGRPGARLTLGSLYAQKGQYEDAVTAYEGALEIMRGPAREGLDEQTESQWAENEEIASFNLAQLLARIGDDERAAAAYRAFLEREPDNIAALSNLAVVLSRMGDEAGATAIYEQLLGRSDLTDLNYFDIGVGLFRADDHERAAEAFRRSVELNPYSRDATYNLAQALYLLTTEIEEAKEAAPAAEQTALDERLAGVHEELRATAERLVEMDPGNQNAYALLARAYRGLGEVAATEADGDQLRRRALSTLERYEALPFQILDIGVASGEGSATVSGNLLVLKDTKTTEPKIAEGAPITLRFTLVGPQGQTVGEQEIEIAAPTPDAPAAFEAEIPIEGEISGWKYAIVE